MQRQIHHFLFLLIPVLVSPSPQNTTCIVGCKCTESDSIGIKLNIVDCDSPLTLTKDIFSDVSKKVSAISIKNSVITKIDENAFKHFDHLEVVVVENSTIGSIDPEAYFNLLDLQMLSFTATIFGENPNLKSDSLEELIFSDCKLTQIPNLSQLPELTFLNVANNQIEHVDEKTFAQCRALEEVTLSNNSITKLPINLFANNENFHTLNADYNPISSFQLNLTSELEYLSLRHCDLSLFDHSSTKNLDTLTSLDLSGNQINILPIDAFEIMEDLYNLDLSNNKLIELDDEIFAKNLKLAKITLDNNPFAKLPHFRPHVEGHKFETYYFSCKNCSIKFLNNTFEHMPGLLTIDLSNNKIDKVGDAFTNILGLTDLDLSHNNITKIEANSLSKINTLNLSHNPLKPLDPVVFANFKELEKLDVSDCKLTQLWTNHNSILSSLQQLLLKNNNLTSLTVDDVQVTPTVHLLDLRNNPLKCDNQLHDFLQFITRRGILDGNQIDTLKTHDALMFENVDIKPESLWKQLIKKCNMDALFDDKEEYDDEDDDDDVDIDEDEEDEDEDDDDYVHDNFINDFHYETKTEKSDDYEDLDIEGGVVSSVLSGRNLNLARASYILSITSVFILTALVVLTIAVSITLLILKRNKSFNMHNGNLPRFKIPLWHTTPGQKRHSGSVYKPLSEDLSGPRTPIINRYEFKQTPQVHNSIP